MSRSRRSSRYTNDKVAGVKWNDVTPAYADDRFPK
jgi:hypothetical protein